MIRRDDPDGAFLITQDDHATVAGRIAAQWGNGAFPAPSPRQAVIDAIAYHDAGWALHDDRPVLNGRHEPATFYEMPLKWYVRVWVASVSAAVARAGPMAGLIVSWHFDALAKFAPLDEQDEAVRHLLYTFRHNQTARQREYCRSLGLSLSLANDPPRPQTDLDRHALYNLNVLRVCDWLSLMLCAGALPKVFLQSPPALQPETSDRVHAAWRDSRTLALDPWPLDVPVLALDVPGKRVPRGSFQREEDLLRVYDNAPRSTLSVHLVPHH